MWNVNRRWIAIATATVLTALILGYWQYGKIAILPGANGSIAPNQMASRAYEFKDPISSRRALITTDPVWRYLLDRVGGTQVDVIYVELATWISELNTELSQNRVIHSWPQGTYVLSEENYNLLKQLDPDWPFDRPLLFEISHDSSLISSFSFNFKAAQRWCDEVAQWMIGQDPVHQELFVLNADLMRVELLALQSRWEKLTRFIGKVEGLTDDEMKILGLDSAGFSKDEGTLVLQFVKNTDAALGKAEVQIHLKSPRTGQIETAHLQLSKKAMVRESWLKVWQSNLSQLEAAIKSLESKI